MEEDNLWILFVLRRWSGFHGKERGEKTSSGGAWATVSGLSEKTEGAQTRSFFLSHISGHFWSHRSLMGNDLCLSLLPSLPVLPSHQHEILRLLSRALEILGKQKPELNSPAMQMCKEAEDIFQNAVECFISRGNHFIFPVHFPAWPVYSLRWFGPKRFQGVLSGLI